jgi:hypothetical protein
MKPLAACFRAELVKWRKSWVLVTIVLAPLCQSGFLLIILWFSGDVVRRFRPGFEFWVELNYLAWNLVFMPIVAALVCGLSWDLEWEAKAWNLLLIQPVPRRTHYLVKLLSHLSLLGLAQLLLALLLIPEGLLLRAHLQWIMGDVAAGTLCRFAGFALLASIPLAAFQTWISKRFTGLGVALGSALGGTWLCARFAGKTAFLQLAPWGMTCQVIAFFDRWHRHIPWEYVPGSLLCAAIVMALGTLGFSRDREPKR